LRLVPGGLGHALMAARTADLPSDPAVVIDRIEVGDGTAVDAVHHRRIDQIANLETRDEVLVEADPKTRADLPHEARTDASELQALVAARELDPRAADACAGGDHDAEMGDAVVVEGDLPVDGPDLEAGRRRPLQGERGGRRGLDARVFGRLLHEGDLAVAVAEPAS